MAKIRLADGKWVPVDVDSPAGAAPAPPAAPHGWTLVQDATPMPSAPATPSLNAPQPNAAPLQGGSPRPDDLARNGRALAWHIILGIDLGILALLFGAQALLGFLAWLQPNGSAASFMDRAAGSLTPLVLLENGAFVFVLAGVVPALWVLATRVQPRAGFGLYLNLRQPLRGIGWGAVLAVSCIAAEYVLAAVYVSIYAALHHESLRDAATANASALTAGIGAALTPALVLLVPAMAALGEEVLFRGVLQRWVGVWGQGLLFGLAHAGYGTVLQLVFPMALGIAFGYVYKRTRNLWVTIVAHFLLDVLALSAAYLHFGGA